MKWGCGILAAAMLLTGCAAQPVYETIGDVWANEVSTGQPARLEFGVPEDVELAVMESDGSSKCYQIGNWMLWTEVRPGGDLQATLAALTGLDAPEVISHPLGAYDCAQTAWAVSDEEGDTVLRAAVISDGEYHYCLTLRAPQQEARQAGTLFAQVLGNVYLNDTAP